MQQVYVHTLNFLFSTVSELESPVLAAKSHHVGLGI